MEAAGAQGDGGGTREVSHAAIKEERARPSHGGSRSRHHGRCWSGQNFPAVSSGVGGRLPPGAGAEAELEIRAGEGWGQAECMCPGLGPSGDGDRVPGSRLFCGLWRRTRRLAGKGGSRSWGHGASPGSFQQSQGPEFGPKDPVHVITVMPVCTPVHTHACAHVQRHSTRRPGSFRCPGPPASSPQTLL